MNEPNIVHKFNEDNPHVLEKLMKEIIQQEDDQVILGNRLMMLRQVNRGWRTAVEGCLPHFEALTIEVFSSKPADFEKEAEESNNTSSILRNEEFKHVRDIAGEFGRLSALTEHDVAFELKGPLLRVHFEALPALVRSLQEGVLARVDHRTGKPLQMKTRTLSLAIIDRYRHQRNGPSVVGDPLDAYQCKYQYLINFTEVLLLVTVFISLSCSTTRPGGTFQPRPPGGSLPDHPS